MIQCSQAHPASVLWASTLRPSGIDSRSQAFPLDKLLESSASAFLADVGLSIPVRLSKWLHYSRRSVQAYFQYNLQRTALKVAWIRCGRLKTLHETIPSSSELIHVLKSSCCFFCLIRLLTFVQPSFGIVSGKRCHLANKMDILLIAYKEFIATLLLIIAKFLHKETALSCWNMWIFFVPNKCARY